MRIILQSSQQQLESITRQSKASIDNQKHHSTIKSITTLIKSMSDLNILRFHSLVFTVSNAKTASSYFIRNFGFKSYAYKGLETIPEDGNRDFAYHAVTCNDILFVFKSP